ncbi:MAG: undecaprenyldiphospho-muramoylpentapeptide beta-N-acetylglucosaminyltransferase [Alphaproteobacteria bacterium]|nr:undecaprenyldiphospho-muramoylpentapeptide beta-N-acetylglucosaminyltransferase [Alphaproteobacteria bacterium]
MKKNLIVLTTGGTGGHIFPAEAVASYLVKQKDYKLAFITDKRIQKRISGTLATLPVYYICASSITGRGFFGKVKAAFKLAYGTLQAVRVLIKLRPRLVVGFGGYASVPAVLAAQFLHIPVALHEQNAVLGRANRLLARRTCLIATTFTPTKQIPQGAKTIQTGMPVRPQIIAKANTPYPTDTEEFRLFIMGGSQGARAFSDILPKALVALSPELKAKLVLTQQVRAEDMDRVQEEYRNSGIKSINLSPFFDNVPEILSDAHLVISRSGASSLAEFSMLGRPALLIPLPTAADDHQTANARIWTADGAGWLMVEKETTPEVITERLTSLMENPTVLTNAAQCALNTNPKISADKALADAITDILKEKAK